MKNIKVLLNVINLIAIPLVIVFPIIEQQMSKVNDNLKIMVNKSVQIGDNIVNRSNVFFKLSNLTSDHESSEWTNIEKILKNNGITSGEFIDLLNRLKNVKENLDLKKGVSPLTYEAILKKYSSDALRIDSFLDAFPEKFQINNVLAQQYIQSLVRDLNGTKSNARVSEIQINNDIVPRVIDLKANVSSKGTVVDLKNKGFNNVIKIASIDVNNIASSAFRFEYKATPEQTQFSSGLLVFRNEAIEPIISTTTPGQHSNNLNIFGRWLNTFEDFDVNSKSKPNNFKNFVISKKNNETFDLYVQLKQGEEIVILNNFNGKLNSAVRNFGYLEQKIARNEDNQLFDSNFIDSIQFFSSSVSFKKDKNDPDLRKFDIYVGSNVKYTTPLFARTKTNIKILKGRYTPLRDSNGINQNFGLDTSFINDNLQQTVIPNTIKFTEKTFNAQEKQKIKFDVTSKLFGNRFYENNVLFNKKFLSFNAYEATALETQGFVEKISLGNSILLNKVFFQKPIGIFQLNSNFKQNIPYEEFLFNTTKAKLILTELYREWSLFNEEHGRKYDFVNKRTIKYTLVNDKYSNINPNFTENLVSMDGKALYREIVTQEKAKNQILTQIKAKYSDAVNQYKIDTTSVETISNYSVNDFEIAFGGTIFNDAIKTILKMKNRQSSLNIENSIEELLFKIVSSKYNEQTTEFNNQIQLEFSTSIAQYLNLSLTKKDDIQAINSKYFTYDSISKLFSINSKENQFTKEAKTGLDKIKSLIDLLFTNNFGRALFSTTDVSQIYASIVNRVQTKNLYDDKILSSNQVDKISQSKLILNLYNKLFIIFNKDYNLNTIKKSALASGEKINFSSSSTNKNSFTVQKIMNNIFKKLVISKINFQAKSVATIFQNNSNFELNFSNILVSAANIYTALEDRKTKNSSEQDQIDSFLSADLINADSMISYSFLVDNENPLSFSKDLSNSAKNIAIYKKLQIANLNNLIKITSLVSPNIINALDQTNIYVSALIIWLGLLLLGISAFILVKAKSAIFNKETMLRNILIGAMLVGLTIIVLGTLPLVGIL